MEVGGDSERVSDGISLAHRHDGGVMNSWALSEKGVTARSGRYMLVCAWQNRRCVVIRASRPLRHRRSPARPPAAGPPTAWWGHSAVAS